MFPVSLALNAGGLSLPESIENCQITRWRAGAFCRWRTVWATPSPLACFCPQIASRPKIHQKWVQLWIGDYLYRLFCAVNICMSSIRCPTPGAGQAQPLSHLLSRLLLQNLPASLSPLLYTLSSPTLCFCCSLQGLANLEHPSDMLLVRTLQHQTSAVRATQRIHWTHHLLCK